MTPQEKLKEIENTLTFDFENSHGYEQENLRFLISHIKGLEAQNKKMREALEDISSEDDEGHSYKNQRAQDIRWARKALTEGEMK